MKYESPKIVRMGSFTDLTLGQGGTSLDGNGQFNQTGGGNDDQDDGGPNSNQ